jgi:hypothetical protein
MTRVAALTAAARRDATTAGSSVSGWGSGNCAHAKPIPNSIASWSRATIRSSPSLVGGDDVYQSLFARDGGWGRLTQAVGEKLSGRSDMACPWLRGKGLP